MSEGQALPDTSHDSLVAQLQAILGTDHVITDEAERAYYSQDVYNQGPTVLAVIQPDTKEKLSKAIAAITGAGVAVFPRGGGFS